MAFKTYAMLGTSAGIADADLVAIFHGSGPLTSVTAAQVRGYCQTFATAALVTASAAAPAGAVDYLQLKPSDYGAGKPGLFVAKSSTATTWTLSVTDGSSLGELDIGASLLKVPACTSGSAGLNIPQGAAPTAPNDGDVWMTSAGLFHRANGATVPPVAWLHLRNQTGSGVANSESFISGAGGAWTQRVLNTVVTNTVAGASLASNQITLPAGTYECLMQHAAVYQQGGANLQVQHRLRNVTDGATLLAAGQSGSAMSGASVVNPMTGQFTLSGAKVVELEIFWTGSGAPGLVFLTGGAFGEVQAHTDLYLRKIA